MNPSTTRRVSTRTDIRGRARSSLPGVRAASGTLRSTTTAELRKGAPVKKHDLVRRWVIWGYFIVMIAAIAVLVWSIG